MFSFLFFFPFFLHFLASPTTKPATTLAPTCPPGWIHCNNTSICIKREWLCDGVANCPGYWDEMPKNCPSMFLSKFLGISLELLVLKRFRIGIVSKFRELSSGRPAVIVRSAYNVGGIHLRRGTNLWESLLFVVISYFLEEFLLTFSQANHLQLFLYIVFNFTL